MKTLIKYLAFVLLAVSVFSCVDELEETTYKGKVQLKLTTTADLTADADYSVKAKFYREYTGEYEIVELDVDSIYGDTLVVTEAYDVEYGNWELQQANLLNDGEPEFVGIDEDDDRASQVEESSLLPIAQNVLQNETTAFALKLVEFDYSEDEEIDDRDEDEVLTIAEFLALEDGEVGTIQAEVTEVSVNESYGTVSYLMVKDSDGDELKVYSVYNVSDVVYEVGQTLLIKGERTTYGDVDELVLSADSGHSITIVEADGSDDNEDYITIAEFLALEDGVTATIQGEVTEVSVNDSYGTVTYMIIKDTNGDEVKAYGVYNISDVVYEVGQTLLITGEKDTYNEVDEIVFDSENTSHSITIVDADDSGDSEDYITIAEFLALEDGVTATIQGEVTEVSVNDSYGTVTYMIIKDDNGDEVKAYGVYNISDVIYEVGQTLLITGEKDTYNEVDEIVFDSENTTHAITIVSDADDSSDDSTDGDSGTTTGAGTSDSPYTVAQALTVQDGSSVWVEGYIMGNVTSGPTLVTDVSSATDYSVAIAASADETDISNMLIVKLDSGDPRTYLGVASTNGASIGYHVKLNGTLENYYGVPGLKSVSSSDNYVIITE